VVLLSLKAGSGSDLAISESSSSASGIYDRDLGFMTMMGPIWRPRTARKREGPPDQRRQKYLSQQASYPDVESFKLGMTGEGGDNHIQVRKWWTRLASYGCRVMWIRETL